MSYACTTCYKPTDQPYCDAHRCTTLGCGRPRAYNDKTRLTQCWDHLHCAVIGCNNGSKVLRKVTGMNPDGGVYFIAGADATEFPFCFEHDPNKAVDASISNGRITLSGVKQVPPDDVFPKPRPMRCGFNQLNASELATCTAQATAYVDTDKGRFFYCDHHARRLYPQSPTPTPQDVVVQDLKAEFQIETRDLGLGERDDYCRACGSDIEAAKEPPPSDLLDLAKSILDMYIERSEQHEEDYWGEVQAVMGMVERFMAAEAKKTDKKHCETCVCGRRAPVQGEARGARSAPTFEGLTLKRDDDGYGPGTIAWEEHCLAWAAYSTKHGRDQDAERMAQRGGFGYFELIMYLGRAPKTWKPR